MSPGGQRDGEYGNRTKAETGEREEELTGKAHDGPLVVYEQQNIRNRRGRVDG